MSLLQDLQEDIASRRDHAEQRRLRTCYNVDDIRAVIKEANDNATRVPPIALDMFIAAREEFYGGWVLWLGDAEAVLLPPEMRQQLPSASNQVKAKYFVRLSVWRTDNEVDPVDVTSIPDGAEIFVRRVTGLKLYERVPQGNANRVEALTVVDDDEAAVPANVEAMTKGAAGPSEEESHGIAAERGLYQDLQEDLDQSSPPPTVREVAKAPLATVPKSDREGEVVGESSATSATKVVSLRPNGDARLRDSDDIPAMNTETLGAADELEPSPTPKCSVRASNISPKSDPVSASDTNPSDTSSPDAPIVMKGRKKNKKARHA